MESAIEKYQKYRHWFKTCDSAIQENYIAMEKMDNGKWAIMEKVFHEDEEKLTDLATFILRLSESPVGIKQCNQELEDAKVGMDRGARYLQEDIEGMGYKW